MKTHLNLYIDKELLKQVKAYAKKRQISVSHLVEEYLSRTVKSAEIPKVIHLIEGLEKPNIVDGNLKKAFHEQR